jgi:hypothetical protein
MIYVFYSVGFFYGDICLCFQTGNHVKKKTIKQEENVSIEKTFEKSNITYGKLNGHFVINLICSFWGSILLTHLQKSFFDKVFKSHF